MSDLGARARNLSSTGIVIGLLVLSIVVGAVLTAIEGRNFFSQGNLTSLLVGVTVLGFIAIGQTLVILIGSLDLSVPYVVSLVSVLAAGVMDGQAGNVVPAVALVLLVAVAVGLVNGALVAFLGVHGFIATLGIGLVISGYLATNYQGSHGSAPRVFRLIGVTRIGPVPVATFLLIACAVLIVVLLRRTRLGHHIYAVGGSSEVSRLSGVRTSLPVLVAHMLCSLFSALAGLVLLARLSVGSPTIGSQGGYDLMSIAAVVLGGTVLAGGKGSVVGTLAGVGIFAVLDNVMGVMSVNAFLQDVVRGLVIVVAVAVYARRQIGARPERFDTSPSRATTLQEAS